MNAIPMIDAALLYIEDGSPVCIDTAAGEAVCSDVATAVETLLNGKPVVVRRTDATAVLGELDWRHAVREMADARNQAPHGN